MATRYLDLQGLKCPLPALRVRKALRAMAEGQCLMVSCTDPLAALDIPNLLRETGDTLEGCEQSGDALLFRIKRRSRGPAGRSE